MHILLLIFILGIGYIYMHETKTNKNKKNAKKNVKKHAKSNSQKIKQKRNQHVTNQQRRRKKTKSKNKTTHLQQTVGKKIDDDGQWTEANTLSEETMIVMEGDGENIIYTDPVYTHPLARNKKKKDLKQAIIYSEILSKPKGWE